MDAPAPTTSPLVRRYRLEEFFQLEPPAAGGHYELIAGVLYMVPPPRWSHNQAASRLNVLLVQWLERHPDRGMLLFPRAAIWTSDDTYLEPDMFVISSERLATMDPEQPTSADLVVEISSPSTAVYDRTTKADTYAALGVAELWLVDLERRAIEQRVLVDGRWHVAGTFAGRSALESVACAELRIVPDDVFA